MPMPARPTRRRLATALDILREDASVEVAKTSNPGELDGVLHRAGGRTVVVAGGDGSMHAVVTALYKRHELAGSTLGLLPMGTGNDFARGNDIPLEIEDAARLIAHRRGPQGRPDRRRDRQHRGQQRPRRGGRAGQPQGRQVEDPARRGRRRQGQPRQARLPHRCCPVGVQPARWRLRVEVDGEVVHDVDAPRPDGGDRQRRQRRRRHRAQPRRRHRGRPARRDDQSRGEADGQGRPTSPSSVAASTRSATTCCRCAGGPSR